MQWYCYNESAITRGPLAVQGGSTSGPNADQHRPQAQPPQPGSQQVGLSRSHLPPNVTRPPGMQPLVLRTTAPRTMSSAERLLHLMQQQEQRQQQQQQQQSADDSRVGDAQVGCSKLLGAVIIINGRIQWCGINRPRK